MNEEYAQGFMASFLGDLSPHPVTESDAYDLGYFAGLDLRD